MTKAQIQKLISEGFSRLYPLTYKSWTDHRAAMFDYELKLQKQFRAARPVHPSKYQQTSTTVAQYFVVKAIRDAIFNPKQFRPRDILHCKQSYLTAHALADDDRFDLEEMFIGFEWDLFDQIDWADADLAFISNEEAA